jgi:hypothetical protein
MRFALFALLSIVPSVLAGQFTTGSRQSSLTPFRSEKELSDYLERILRRREEASVARDKAQCNPMKVSRKQIKASSGRGSVGHAIISGRVTASHVGTPVTGAMVLWGRNAAATDSTGHFRLVARDVTAADSTRTLRVRAIGYHTLSDYLRLAAGDSVFIDAKMCMAALELSQVVLTASAPGAPGITNVQEAGVDEGGLVKLAGDYLVILRRGRLFTVAVGGGALRPVAAVNAFPPSLEKDDAWYDELLVYRDRIIVIGYGYRRRGAEVGLFRLDSAGGIRYEATYNFRAHDYYSSRNYASRLVGSTLVMYNPLYLADAKTSMPAMRRWRPGGDAAPLQPMVHAGRVYRPPRDLDPGNVALHSLITCDLAKADIDCAATVVIAAAGRVSYASPTAMYLWTGPSSDGGEVLYRMSLNGAAPTAIRVEGMPIDQFSFRESMDGHLDVFVINRGHGEGMWGAEWAKGKAALVRVALDRFGDGRSSLPRSAYRFVTASSEYPLQNRFVGDWLLFGAGNGWGRQDSKGDVLHAVPTRGGAVATIAVPHGVDRIEPMGANAVVIGTGSGNLHFTGIDLARHPTVAQQFVVPGASQGELRSHGFFYRRDSDQAGVLGLPIRESSRPGFAHLIEGSASIVFVRREGRELAGLGNLVPTVPRDTADGCVASCVDWYGNARPIFLGDRVLALLGYELVEGAVRNGRIAEVARTSLLR